MVYRNYEVDPYYGDSTYCANATQIGFDEQTTSVMTVEKGEEQWYAQCRFTSSPGYTVKNLVVVTNVKPVTWLQGFKQPQINFTMTAAYIECDNCRVFHQSYVEGGCTLWKPESKINEEQPCCEFVYDMLCGTSPKYHISKNC
ncbi:hypothetical protein V5799_008814 [Amblyomma americanum]|uniref:Lipocalin n=1 Tax=Amblyomma americanum TaxID=6943 RepID=A0AAQ4FDN1_AMBAM